MEGLSIRQLAYETEGGTRILESVDLHAGTGEIHALLGTNGTGKSTLAALVMGTSGMSAPTSGSIEFNGVSLAGMPVHERAGLGITMAWQEPARFEGITVRDYLSLRAGGVGPEQCLALVGLAPKEYLDRCVDKRLSGGERKRIELASALSVRPRLAILDEPDSGIDLLSTDDLLNVIETFRREGSGVLLITHRRELVGVADRASLLCYGRIICEGEPARVAEYYLGRKCIECVRGECIHV
jgi:Fe-S cluster assembly ATP-binding protein